MTDISLDIVRPQDLLVVRLEFTGWALDSAAPGGARLVRARDSQEGLLVAHLPSQALIEPCFQDDGGLLVGQPVAPHFAPSILAGPTRLAFRIPDAVASLPLTLPALLDWEQFEAVAAIDEVGSVQDGPALPGAQQTAIELPYRLVLTTVAGARWIGANREPTSEGAVALWQVQLAAAATGVAAVRAAWTPDLDHPFDPFALNTLTAAARREVVEMTGDPRMLFATETPAFSDDERLLLRQVQAQSGPIPVERLALSALGGDLCLRRRWDFPPIEGRVLDLIYGPDAGLSMMGRKVFALHRWEHATKSGRDNRVRTVTAGRMCPYHHEATQDVVSERVLRRTVMANDNTAHIGQRAFVSIIEPLRRYDSADWPFQTLRICAETLEVPADGSPFPVAVVATDWAGQEHAFSVPMLFAPLGAPAADLVARYAALARDVPAGGQPITYVKPAPPGDGSAARDAARFPTLSLRVAAKSLSTAPGGFAPLLESASIRLEGLEGIARSAAPAVEMTYDPTFIARGSPAEDGQFARLTSSVQLALGGGAVGGLATPQATLDRLSVRNGLSVAGASEGVDPQQVLNALGGRLLGFVDLQTIIDSSADMLDKARPILKTIRDGSARRIEFEWEPRLRLRPPLLVQAGHGSARLHVKGVIAQQADGSASASTQGELEHFAIGFDKLVQVGFARLAFTLRSGEPPQLGSVDPSFEFLGDLAFLKPIAEVLKTAAPGSAPGTRVELRHDSLVASFRQTLPNIALGQFALVNIALSAALTLRFAEPAVLTLGLSSRRDPFLVSYSAIGGGGFFALDIDVSGPRALEASIELGAVAEVDLFVAKGSARILIGIYLAWRAASGSELGGFVRIHGALQVLGIVTLGIDVMLMLRYVGSVAYGRAEVTLYVQVLMFSKSVTLSVERSFDTGLPSKQAPSRQQRFADALDLPQWRAYCEAFAD